MENSSISVCLNELQLLERNEVCLQIKLRAAAALFAATEQSNDAIDITSEDFEVQVRVSQFCVCYIYIYIYMYILIHTHVEQNMSGHWTGGC